MHDFQYSGDELFCEGVPIRAIADKVGTPFYLYSLHTLESHFQAFDTPFSKIKHLICFSVKANSNLAVLRVFARLGGGVDVVSGGRAVPGHESRRQSRPDRLFGGGEAAG